jgi:hypothetical protein
MVICLKDSGQHFILPLSAAEMVLNFTGFHSTMALVQQQEGQRVSHSDPEDTQVKQAIKSN